MPSGRVNMLTIECSRPKAIKVANGNQIPNNLPTELLAALLQYIAKPTHQLPPIAFKNVPINPAEVFATQIECNQVQYGRVQNV